jgi:hypothetical protein
MLLEIQVQTHSMGALGYKHIRCILNINVHYEHNFISALTYDNVYNKVSKHEYIKYDLQTSEACINCIYGRISRLNISSKIKHIGDHHS